MSYLLLQRRSYRLVGIYQLTLKMRYHLLNLLNVLVLLCDHSCLHVCTYERLHTNPQLHLQIR